MRYLSSIRATSFRWELISNSWTAAAAISISGVAAWATPPHFLLALHHRNNEMRRISIIQRGREFEMSMSNATLRRTLSFLGVLCIGVSAGTSWLAHCPQTQAGQPPSAQAPAPARPVGTIKSISGNFITLTPDPSNDGTGLCDGGTQLVNISPGT